MMKKEWIVLGIALLLSPLAGFAGDPPPLAKNCVTCHGADGVSTNPEWPNLAGQNANYIALQIIAFRDGERSNPMMDSLVSDLTDEDARVLSTWYASLDGTVSASGDESLVATGENLSGYCKACHGME